MIESRRASPSCTSSLPSAITVSWSAPCPPGVIVPLLDSNDIDDCGDCAAAAAAAGVAPGDCAAAAPDDDSEVCVIM
jgi:hypothetical protein